MTWNHKQTYIVKPLPEGLTFRDGKFYRDCPGCGKELVYSRRDAAMKRHRAKCLCKSCGQTRRQGHIHFGGVDGVAHSVTEKFRKLAQMRGLEFTLTTEQIALLMKQQNSCCALSGLPVELTTVKSIGSIDRIDNKKGYTLDNIQIVHKEINIMRGTLTIERFRELCKLVVDA